MINCIDLFSGCGGFSLGFEKANFNIVCAFDNWKPAIEVYQENFSHPIIEQDLSNEKETISKLKEFSFDLVMGGPPCQDFSSAGKRDLSAGRADLTYNFANIVCSVKPKWFVMENVEQIKKSYILQHIVQQFIREGYGLSSFILNASYYLVPQARTRFFLIGNLDGKHNQLDQIIKRKASKKPMTVKEYLGNSLGLEYYYRHPRNYNRRGIFSINEPSPTVRGVNRPVPKGYKINSCDPQNVNLEDIRALTTIERSYIQTFPKTFKFNGTKTNLEQMIGNAVPVNLAKNIAETIKTYIRGEFIEEPKENFLFELEEKEEFQIPQKALQKL